MPHLRVVPFDAKAGINHLRLRASTLACLLCLLGSAPAATAPPEAQQAQWLSQQLHRPVQASQILVSPRSTTLEGCTITRTRRAPTGATALSLRCPASRLPHLLLLNASPATRTDGPNPPVVVESGRVAHIRPLLANVGTSGPHPPVVGECGIQRTPTGGPHPPAVGECGVQPNIVRAGAALRADWRTAFIHAQLPVVALDSGAAGAEIRVRIPQTHRIVRARILSADVVAIVVAGA